MYSTITSVGNLAKGFKVERTKGESDELVTIAAVKFTGLEITREQFDELLGQPYGWAHDAFFDGNGEPRFRFEFKPLKFAATISGRISGNRERDQYISFIEAKLADVVFAARPHGAYLSGSITWKAAGDEVSDLESLLLQTCLFAVTIQDAQQKDLFGRSETHLESIQRETRGLCEAMAAAGGGSVSINGQTVLTVPPAKEVDAASVPLDELMKQGTAAA